jgi:hypothetical protein
MPRGRKFTAEQIIGKLREAEVELAECRRKCVLKSDCQFPGQFVIKYQAITRRPSEMVTENIPCYSDGPADEWLARVVAID